MEMEKNQPNKHIVGKKGMKKLALIYNSKNAHSGNFININQ